MKSYSTFFLGITILLSGSLLLLTGCNDDADKQPVDKKFILKTNSKLQNSAQLRQIQQQIRVQLPHLHEMGVATGATPAGPIVKLSDAVAKLFDPESGFCALPDKVSKKLKKLKEENKAWAPSYVSQQLAHMPDSAVYLNGASLATLVHTVTIKHHDGTSFSWPVIGSPTFKSLSIADYLQTAAYGSFAYTLDCSGYLNAAIEASGTVPGADIKTQASAALQKQSSLFIGGGVLVSPLYAAVYPEGVGISIDTALRIKILKSLLAIPSLRDDDIIDTRLSYEVIWASRQGSSSFNGAANISGRGGLGIGVAQVSASGQAGGSVSRTSTFTSFDTYVTKRELISNPQQITVAYVKTVISQLTPSH